MEREDKDIIRKTENEIFESSLMLINEMFREFLKKNPKAIQELKVKDNSITFEIKKGE